MKKSLRRDWFSNAATLIDPVCWLGLIGIIYKTIIQKLWTCGNDWDEKLPADLLDEWNIVLNDLQQLADYSLQSCIFSPNSVEKSQFQLFTDASDLTYAAVWYVNWLTRMDSLS